MTACAFTSVCEEDACWIDQYLLEAERLATPFCIHLDRCSPAIKRKLVKHRLCAGATEQADSRVEFNEQHKQAVFDMVVKLGFQWAMAWDIDETYERLAPEKIERALQLDVDYVDIRWLNLWNDTKHVRTDGPFSDGHRVKFYNLRVGPWTFAHKIVNGAKIVGKDTRMGKSDLVCLHHGMLTLELRQLHKERWDRIYSTALNGDRNPYGFWKYALEVPARVSEHDYI
jgi:hypothetical protein